MALIPTKRNDLINCIVQGDKEFMTKILEGTEADILGDEKLAIASGLVKRWGRCRMCSTSLTKGVKVILFEVRGAPTISFCVNCAKLLGYCILKHAGEEFEEEQCLETL